MKLKLLLLAGIAGSVATGVARDLGKKYGLPAAVVGLLEKGAVLG